MSRPHDWWVLDLDRDPTPGDPWRVREMARAIDTLGDDAASAERDVRSVAGDQAVLSWIGAAGDVFRDAIGELPAQLHKLADSYHQCSDALTGWAGDLTTAQDQADRALADGRAARDQLAAAQSSLASAESALGLSASSVDRLNQAAADAPAQHAEPPDEAAVRAAVRNHAAAQQRVAGAEAALGDANEALDLAKRMAAEAAALRDESADRADERIRDAADAGIPPNSFWEDLGNLAAQVWDAVVSIAKVVVAVLGIVVLIIGGPLAWVVFAAALIVLADTIMKYMQGKASLWAVAFAALDCIPGTRGLTTLGALSDAFRAGGLLGAGAHVLGSARTALTGFTRMAQRFRQGALPALDAMWSTLPDAFRAAGDAPWTQSVSAFVRTMGDARSGAVNSAWAAHVADVGATNPARAAELWQGYGPYSGVDAWGNDTLASGTGIEAGWPGTSGFAVPEGTAAAYGNDASSMWEATQVAPSATYGDRTQVVTFETASDIPAATSHTSANPQYGAGGATQHYVPDFNNRVVAGEINAIDGAGNSLPASLNDRGQLVVDWPDGSVIRLEPSTRVDRGIPTDSQVAGSGPRLHQTAAGVVTVPWDFEQAGSGR